MTPSVVVRHPPGYEPERRYAYEVVLQEFLGLETTLVRESRSDVELTLTDATGGPVTVPDVLFAHSGGCLADRGIAALRAARALPRRGSAAAAPRPLRRTDSERHRRLRLRLLPPDPLRGARRRRPRRSRAVPRERIGLCAGRLPRSPARKRVCRAAVVPPDRGLAAPPAPPAELRATPLARRRLPAVSRSSPRGARDREAGPEARACAAARASQARQRPGAGPNSEVSRPQQHVRVADARQRGPRAAECLLLHRRSERRSDRRLVRDRRPVDPRPALPHPRTRPRDRIPCELQHVPRSGPHPLGGRGASPGLCGRGSRRPGAGRPAALPPLAEPGHVAELGRRGAGVRLHADVRRSRRLSAPERATSTRSSTCAHARPCGSANARWS